MFQIGNTYLLRSPVQMGGFVVERALAAPRPAACGFLGPQPTVRDRATGVGHTRTKTCVHFSEIKTFKCHECTI